MSTSTLPILFTLSILPLTAFAQPQSFTPVEPWGTAPDGVSPLVLGLYSTPEIQQPVDLEISGTIPSWLKGSLYRGAQAGWDIGNYTSEHWFDGFTRNHRFEIDEGKVTYRSRNASDEVSDFIKETGLYPGSSFGGDPCKVVLGAFESTFRDESGTRVSDSGEAIKVSYIKNFPGLAQNSTNFGPFVTLASTTDGTSFLQQFDTVTLEPIELFTFSASGGGIGHGMTSAHPGIGGEGMWDEGAVYNYVLDVTSEPPVYQVVNIQANGQGKVLANITDAPPAYIHSLFSTEHYAIMIVWQCDLGPPPKENSGILDMITPWNPERPVYFYVVDKEAGGVVAKYTTSKSFFAFHEVNSFEENGDIIIDIPTMPNASWLKAARMENLRSNLGNSSGGAFDLQSVFQRYRLRDFANGKVENGTLIELEAVLDFELPIEVGGLELPRINEAYLRRPYRYAYGIHTEKRGYFADSIVKIDTKTQSSKIWSPETNHVPSEPIFVARPGAKGEDDGVLLTMALDSATSRSNLVVINAKNMKEIGRAKMPIAAGYGFHGIWGSEQSCLS